MTLAGAHTNFVELVENGRALNSKIFSPSRLEILSHLFSLGSAKEGALYRELKKELGVSDGKLIFDLNELKKMGYLEKQIVKVGKKKMDSYYATPAGCEAFEKALNWLEQLLKGARGNEFKIG